MIDIFIFLIIAAGHILLVLLTQLEVKNRRLHSKIISDSKRLGVARRLIRPYCYIGCFKTTSEGIYTGDDGWL